MIFAIEEINNSTSLLPNISLGYKVFDSCGSIMATMRVAMALLNGNDTSGQSCSDKPPIHTVIGASESSSTIIMLRALGAFQIPVVNVYNRYSSNCNLFNVHVYFSSLLSFFSI